MVVWAVVWAVVVAAATASVWSAISRAGAHVTNLAAPRMPSSYTVTSTPQPTPAPTPRATARPTPRPTPPPSAQPTARPTPRPTPSKSTTARPAPVAVKGSWSGQAGRVTATCRAQKIRLDAAVPADGFTVEIGNRGPETLEVEFHQSGGEHEIQVKGVCRADGPRFTVEEE